MSLEMRVFNVRRGLCIFVRTPSNYGIVIDCGSSDDFSPIEYIRSQLPACLPWNFCPLTLFILTHPHSDHISDIVNLHMFFRPAIIYRQENLNWNKIKNSNQSNNAFDFYRANFFPPRDYGNKSFSYPNWGDGMEIYCFSLPPDEADKISSTDSEYANNTSIVTLIKYKGYCIAINGDILTEGMSQLLQLNPLLTTNILGYQDDSGAYKQGVDFYVCPHHGHESGFNDIWFIWSGPTRRFNIVSERRKRPNERPEQVAVSSKYSMDDYCLGLNREGKKIVSTKSGNHIQIEIHDNGQWAWGYF